MAAVRLFQFKLHDRYSTPVVLHAGLPAKHKKIKDTSQQQILGRFMTFLSVPKADAAPVYTAAGTSSPDEP